MAIPATLIRDMDGTVWDSPTCWTKTVKVPAGTSGTLEPVPNNRGIARFTVKLADGTTAEVIAHRSDVKATSSTPTGIPVGQCDICGHSHPLERRHCTHCGRASVFTTPAGPCIACKEVSA